MGVVQLGDVTPGRHRRGRPDGRHGLPPRRAAHPRARPHADRQVLLFSATLDGAVATLAAATQRQPVRHEVGPEGPDITAARHVVLGGRARRPARRCTAAIVEALGSTMVFCRTRHGADRLAQQLGKLGVSAGADPRRPQPAAARPGAQSFSKGEVPALDRDRRRRPRRARRRRRRRSCTTTRRPTRRPTSTAPGRTARAGASGTVVSLVEPAPAPATPASSASRSASTCASPAPTPAATAGPAVAGRRAPRRPPARRRRRRRPVHAAGRPAGRHGDVLPRPPRLRVHRRRRRPGRVRPPHERPDQRRARRPASGSSSPCARAARAPRPSTSSSSDVGVPRQHGVGDERRRRSRRRRRRSSSPAACGRAVAEHVVGRSETLGEVAHALLVAGGGVHDVADVLRERQLRRGDGVAARWSPRPGSGTPRSGRAASGPGSTRGRCW